MTVQAVVESEPRSFAAPRGEGADHGAVLFVPLDKLKPSPRNVRKTPHGADDIEAMAASIAAKKGQQPTQPLIVEPEVGPDDGPTGFFLVTAGEGRRLGLRLLAKRKTIKKTHPVRCLLVINTDRRTYYLELRATPATYMPSIAWKYPTEPARPAPPAVLSPPAIEGVNFNYRIGGDRPPWRPVRVFDDGRQTVIEFPAAVAQSQMPPLFVDGPDGKPTSLVNYRVTGQRIVVDRLFDKAQLKIGSGWGQQKVEIERVKRP